MQNPERDHLFPLCTSTDRNCTNRATGSEKEILLMVSVSPEAEKVTLNHNFSFGAFMVYNSEKRRM